MNSPIRHTLINQIALEISQKVSEIEEARARDAEFVERKKLYLELRKLSDRFQKVVHETIIPGNKETDG